MTEQTFLKEGNVLITNARLNVAGQTFVVGNITSFKTVELGPITKAPDRVAGFGLILGISTWALAALNSYDYSALFGCLAFAPFFTIFLMWRRNQKSTYSVVLKTAAGEEQAVTSKDKAFILKITNALDNAVIARAKTS
jgi:hypothetical protein